MTPRNLKTLSFLTLALCAGYFFFPNDDELHTLGIGAAGSRILVLDLAVGFMVLNSRRAIQSTLKLAMGSIGKWPAVFLFGAASVSLLRGLPLFGGLAVGEARWYFAAVVLVPFSLVYDQSWFERFRLIVIWASLWHALSIFGNILAGEFRGEADTVMRVGGGKTSFVIVCGLLVMLDYNLRELGNRRQRFFISVGVVTLFLALVVSQTRSVFVFLFPTLLFYFLTRTKPSMTLLRRTMMVFLLVVATSGVLISLLPPSLQTSVEESFGVIVEAFQPETIQGVLLGEGAYLDYASNPFSKAGNTAFRIVAWTQVYMDVLSTPYAWLVGKPFGSGFEFTDLSGETYFDLDPHNDYLSIFSKVGLVGLAGYILMLFRYYRNAISYGRQALKSNVSILATLSFFLTLFVSLNAEIRSYAIHFWIWPLIGMTLSEMHFSSTRNPILVAGPQVGVETDS